MAITAVGESQSFAYTGTIQEFVVPIDGIYKFEVYGGSNGGTSGGKGGYSIGYKQLEKGTTLYVCVGGNGSTRYNGGGAGYSWQYPNWGSYAWCNGGGATHIATMTGLLSAIGVNNIDQILIVAGGGGGNHSDNYNQGVGGNGGGTSGGAGTTNNGQSPGSGGSQTAGYAFGLGGSKSSSAFGAGGGGGLYGGHAGTYAGGGGGSGYIGGVPAFTYNGTTYSPSTKNGTNANAAHGSATITLMTEKQSFNYPIYIGSLGIEKVYLGETKISNIL